MPTLFVFTRPVDQAQKSQIHEREKRSIRRRLREVNDQVEVVTKRRRTTGHISCDRTQDEEFGNKDMEAVDEDVERICSNQNSDSHSSIEWNRVVTEKFRVMTEMLGVITGSVVAERFKLVTERLKVVAFRVVTKKFRVVKENF